MSGEKFTTFDSLFSTSFPIRANSNKIEKSLSNTLNALKINSIFYVETLRFEIEIGHLLC